MATAEVSSPGLRLNQRHILLNGRSLARIVENAADISEILTPLHGIDSVAEHELLRGRRPYGEDSYRKSPPL
jgi:hypothetical protein